MPIDSDHQRRRAWRVFVARVAFPFELIALAAAWEAYGRELIVWPYNGAAIMAMALLCGTALAALDRAP